MPQTKLGRFIDNISIAFCSTIVFLVWIKKLIRNSYIALFIAIILSFFLVKIIKLFQNKKLKKLNIKNDEKNNISLCNHALRLMPYNKQIQFIKKLFINTKTKQKNYIIYTNEFCVINQLNIDQTSIQNVYEAYQKASEIQNINIENILIFGNKISQEGSILTKNIFASKIEFISPIEMYSLMKAANIFPCDINKKTQKRKIKLQISSIFMRKTANIMLKCGLLLYISSLFVPYYKYYIITASVLLILAIICFIFGKKEQIQTSFIDKIKQSWKTAFYIYIENLFFKRWSKSAVLKASISWPSRVWSRPQSSNDNVTLFVSSFSG